jgi:hypothetical protein
MSELRIVFFGLISHLGVDTASKTKAVLIKDRNHHPKLWLSAQQSYELGQGEMKFYVDNQLIKKDADSTDMQFQKYVPHLGLLTDGDVSDDVQADKDMKHVLATIYYPGGELKARSRYYCRAHYKLGKRDHEQCVAKTTALLFTTSEQERITVYFIDKDKQPWTIDVTDTCIMVSNAQHIKQDRKLREPDCSSPDRREFKKHKAIMDASNIASVREAGPCVDPFVPPPNFQVCQWVDAVIDKLFVDSVEIECGNTNYP